MAKGNKTSNIPASKDKHASKLSSSYRQRLFSSPERFDDIVIGGTNVCLIVRQQAVLSQGGASCRRGRIALMQVLCHLARAYIDTATRNHMEGSLDVGGERGCLFRHL